MSLPSLLDSLITTEGVSRRLGDSVVRRRPAEGPSPLLEPVQTLPALLHHHQPHHHGHHPAQDAQQEEEDALHTHQLLASHVVLSVTSKSKKS